MSLTLESISKDLYNAGYDVRIVSAILAALLYIRGSDKTRQKEFERTWGTAAFEIIKGITNT